MSLFIEMMISEGGIVIGYMQGHDHDRRSATTRIRD